LALIGSHRTPPGPTPPGHLRQRRSVSLPRVDLGAAPGPCCQGRMPQHLGVTSAESSRVALIESLLSSTPPFPL
uniref:Clade I nitrous oxide reductase n=1 Tax=Schistocephalus solidus TaxID=70667 RepID=A0A183TC48_SCHSO